MCLLLAGQSNFENVRLLLQKHPLGLVELLGQVGIAALVWVQFLHQTSMRVDDIRVIRR